MDLSIIITSRNTIALLSDCLTSIYQSLKNSGISFEVIVVDNASTDGSDTMVQKDFASAILIKNKSNAGFGKANNQGFRISQGTHILYLNSDTKIIGDAIEKLLAFSRSHEKSFAGPKLVNPDSTPQTSCGPFFSLPVIFTSLFLKGDVLRITRWSPNEVKKVDWVSGACLIAPRKVIMDGLLFDEDIFMYMEEIDLLYRAKQKGYTVYFYPDARVMHIGSGSSDNKRAGPILNIYKGFQLFYRKHHTGYQLAVLQVILRSKATLGIIIGILTRNTDLRKTYEEALRLV